MRSFRFIGGLVFALPWGSLCAQSPTLSVDDLTLAGGQTGQIVVSGTITNTDAFGVSILVEIVSRSGNLGSVVFTSAPPVDIKQLGHPWPETGAFSPFDTNEPPFDGTLNATVHDDGRYLCDQPVSFSGPLSGFPVVASLDAIGVWDVHLSTRGGDSAWDCDTPLLTTLTSGTITVTAPPAVPGISTWGMVALSLSILSAGSLMLRRAPCTGGKYASN